MNRSLWLWVATIAVVGMGVPQAKAGFSFNGFSGAPAAGAIIDFKLQDFEVLLDASTPTSGPGAINGDPVHDAPIVAAHKVSGGALTTPGQQLYGIYTITSIQSPDGSKQYWTQSATQQLDGEFYGYTATKVTGAGATGEQASFSGGTIQMFFNSSATFNSVPGPFMGAWSNIAVSNGVDAPGQSLFITAAGVGGVNPEPDTGTTLASTFNGFTPNRFTGVGDGFFTVTFSSTLVFQGDAFDSSTSGPVYPYPGNQDFSFKSNFDSRPPGTLPNPGPAPGPLDYQNDTGWSVASQDPLEGVFVAVVPEPASLTLLGIGGVCSALLGLRRRMMKPVA